MIYFLFIALITLFLIFILLKIQPSFIKNRGDDLTSKKDVRDILWLANQKECDLIENIMVGIKSYFDAENVFCAISNSKDEVSIISLELFTEKEVEKFCFAAINKKSLTNYYEFNGEFYTSYLLKVSGFNIGVLLIKHKKQYKLLESDLSVLQSFSDSLCLKQKLEITEEALCKSEADIETIMNNATDGVVFCDKEGFIQRANTNSIMFSDYTNSKDILGRHIDKIFKLTEDDEIVCMEELIEISTYQKKSIKTQRDVLLKKEEKNTHVDIKCIPIFSLENDNIEGSIVFFSDIEAERKVEIEKERHYLELQSEVLQRKEVEKALIRSTALAYAGTLATGVAHEYNNINSIAMGNLDVLLKMDTLPPFVLDCISTIRRTTARGAEITRSLLNYAKDGVNGDYKRESVSLVSLAEETMNLVVREFSKEGIEFSSNFDEIKNDHFVSVNSSQIKQAILNLVLNARHAVSELDKKIISFKINSDDEYVYLEISDTGHGIPEEDIEKLFHPFFTTKGKFAKEESQKKFDGSGLGLAVTNMIMKQHGGSIDVSSDIGLGTRFLLSFSKMTKETEIKENEIKENKDIEIHNGQNKKILVLDDEIELCKLLSDSLTGNGYNVKYTDDGVEALKWNSKDPFDLILTDIQMPKMSGTEFLNNLPINENQKRIVMTGRVNKKDIKGIDMDEFVYKPFDLFSLIGRIQEILGV